MVLQVIARGGGASCAMSLARTLSGQAASSSSSSTCPIDPPEHLVQATLKEVQALMPFSWQIGQFRHRSIEQNGVQVFYKARNSQPMVPSLEADYTGVARAPSDSYLQLVFPFSSSAALRDQYRRFSGDRPRWGILLEDLDTLAGDIAALHAGLKGGKWTPVTAVVDRFNMMTSSSAGEQVDLQSDLRLDGQVTWVGRSSMEVLITLSSRPPPVMPSTPQSQWSTNGSTNDDTADTGSGPAHNAGATSALRGAAASAAGARRGVGTQQLSSLTQHQLAPGTLGSAWRFEGFARFVMAMRDTVARRAVQVAPLAPETERERQLFDQGNEHHVLRKQKRESHWRNKPPSDAEVRLIHQLAVSNLDNLGTSGGGAGIMGAAARASARVNAFTSAATGTGSDGGAGSPAVDLQGSSPLPAVPMHTTELCSTQLMHSQDRNHFSYIFGGHLMRLAFEHSYTTAAMHAGEWCEPVSMEDVVFISSVPVGCILELRAKVVHTRGRHLRVLVEAVLLYPGRREQVTSNLFSFLFLSPSPVPPVIPTTVVEALEFVLGQRQAEEQEQHDRAMAECPC